MSTPPADPSVAVALALRHRVPDGVLLDWLDLAQLLEPPCSIRAAALMRHWCCSQPTVSRRLSRLLAADLIDYGAGRSRRYRIWRLGPTESSTAVPLINEIHCAATDLAL